MASLSPSRSILSQNRMLYGEKKKMNSVSGCCSSQLVTAARFSRQFSRKASAGSEMSVFSGRS